MAGFVPNGKVRCSSRFSSVLQVSNASEYVSKKGMKSAGGCRRGTKKSRQLEPVHNNVAVTISDEATSALLLQSHIRLQRRSCIQDGDGDLLSNSMEDTRQFPKNDMTFPSNLALLSISATHGPSLVS
ncbi:hypothetical protein LENED_000470 [Lentinula edodes]|uniref:Uncharacterized protein n=1 Tax=Lentinula edodes TaxID=5353 RepID=A0A1Q3DVQ8_LENED|nr:hypothetical protein LENED_000470 [Lentinula edodes]